ncbi:UDP-N-acetylmuramoyl-L-alanyl-D-glutamate--2,6-diaminopimelate ligase [Geitlerinema sp. PCC 9228]|uniref:UDP-N-acetylmuramoyl-L-alanyl-D-glutamate--2, 6-diaminopimelate ligase n=1 Tax=Geitlerinema sp. PCC 9228 TaxID=111611 RepID=UPI0008F9C681|nr:UDP-N-acetylmuramoyl-L-alanyl-D-glutamate--2,6-diaminopimelate ligase [Geitlerinema sp. PCC 9228]
MELQELLDVISDRIGLAEVPQVTGDVKRLCTNSHICQQGDLFLGMPGTRVDGGEFWQGAIASGAIAALVSRQAYQQVPPQFQEIVIPVDDMVAACAEVAAAFYGHPTQKLRMVGVTGTNGKTTTTHLIEFLLQKAQQPTALLGTLYARWPHHQETAVHTTPFADRLQQQLSQAYAAGARSMVMEVSSHALQQGRVLGCQFDVAVFTNLSQDHLDFHKTMENYFEAKALLFSKGYLRGQAIVNVDDAYGQRLLERLDPQSVWRYSLTDSSVELYPYDLHLHPDGVTGKIHTPHGEADLSLPAIGRYNLANALAAVGAALQLGADLEAIAAALPQFQGVPGRMEKVQADPNQDLTVVVDYAHTPDSLENVLQAMRPYVARELVCVFGCGGDRDRGKRPIMGQIAAQLADRVVVTSDNPRTEDPETILQDILQGIPEGVSPEVICDRASAISHAIQTAQPGDSVAIVGKGHEDYQIIGTEKIHFDDREQALQALRERNW